MEAPTPPSPGIDGDIPGHGAVATHPGARFQRLRLAETALRVPSGLFAMGSRAGLAGVGRAPERVAGGHRSVGGVGRGVGGYAVRGALDACDPTRGVVPSAA